MNKTVLLPKELTRSWVEREGAALLSSSAKQCIDFDLAATEHFDSAGLSFLFLMGRTCEKAGEKCSLKNVPPHLLAELKKFPLQKNATPMQASPQGAMTRIGTAAFALRDAGTLALSMFTEILYWGTFGLFVRKDMRKGSVLSHMYTMGYTATGIVTLLSFLIGMVLALQAAMQLNRFGAGIFLAAMITISMIKELGPLLTAIILTGRSGSAITAEIATMVVGEEIDALTTMGIHPIQFVVTPKFLALSITMPILSLLATAAGIFGGYVVAVLYLDISHSLIIKEIMTSIRIQDVIENVLKSIVFSWLIVWVGAYHGFRVHGGAEEVGRETTRSVVMGIFIIILTDALFSFFF